MSSVSSVASETKITGLSSIEEIIEEARQGRMFILVDDEDRENEGDLIIPAQYATPDMINFMAKEGRGLICLALEGERCDQLGLPMMAARNTSRHETAFTISIEAREGVSTGISAADRAKTVFVAIDDASKPDDIATPGHIFPLRAREGGSLVRAGHTEAAVDISKLAGLKGAGVICEIMKDDGEMARLDDLLVFASAHNMKVGTIADLIAYRRRTEKLVSFVEEKEMSSPYGSSFKMKIYRSINDGVEHAALICGDVSGDEAVAVRMHSVDIVKDLLGGEDSLLKKSMEYISECGRGVIVLLRQNEAHPLSSVTERKDDKPKTLRHIGLGAQILIDIGIKDMVLLSNSNPNIIGLDAYGLKIDRYQNL